MANGLSAVGEEVRGGAGRSRAGYALAVPVCDEDGRTFDDDLVLVLHGRARVLDLGCP